MISIVAADTTVTWLTPSVETTFGYPAEELIERPLVALVHPGTRAPRLVEVCARAVESGRLQAGLELRLRHADGTWLHTETLISPRLDDETIGGLVLTTRDVTERKQLEATDAERVRVRDMFSRFVPEAVVDELLSRADGLPRLGGETLHGTIMFTDLRNFTSFSESRPAQEVIAVINQFLSEQTETIMAHGGTIIAYLGDGIMAAFGAPIEQEDHADRAIAAARELVAERLPELNEWMRARLRRGLQDGDRVEQRPVHLRQRGQREAAGVHGDRRRLQHRVADPGPDQGDEAHAALLRGNAGAAPAPAPADLVDVGASAIRGRQAGGEAVVAREHL